MTPAESSKADRIAPEDLSNFKLVHKRYADAQGLFQEAQAQLTRAEGAVEFIGEAFASRYDLQVGDRIGADGEIIRAARKAEAE